MGKKRSRNDYNERYLLRAQRKSEETQRTPARVAKEGDSRLRGGRKLGLKGHKRHLPSPYTMQVGGNTGAQARRSGLKRRPGKKKRAREEIGSDDFPKRDNGKKKSGGRSCMMGVCGK